MKHRILAILIVIALVPQVNAQYLDRAWISTSAYEDMSDLMRRLPGMYPLDYGVAGAPVLFRPWGFAPWYLGVERDGIPWSRVSDGLYDSNLDLPDELDTLSLRYDGLQPFATMRLRTRLLPTDTATTEVTLREGYYGFGRVDFAHAQRLNKRIEAEGRGRLWWYDGLRGLPGGNTYSRARFYNLSGKIRYDLGNSWRTKLEYGGANVDAQSPTIVDTTVRPQNYSEREYGTLQLGCYDSSGHVEVGLHARQDRVTREEYFRLRERFLYGYVEGGIRSGVLSVSSRLSVEDVDFSYLEGKGSEALAKLNLRAALSSGVGDLSSRAILNSRMNGQSAAENESLLQSLSASYESPSLARLRLIAAGGIGHSEIPPFWRHARFDPSELPYSVSDVMQNGTYYAGPKWDFESKDYFDTWFWAWHGGVRYESGSTRATATWNTSLGDEERYFVVSDTIYLHRNSEVGYQRWAGPLFEGDIALLPFLRLQTSSHVKLEPVDLSRALDTRSYSRLLFTKDYFKAPLRITSYVAYELIGKHRAVSDIREEVIGPAHLVHFRVEAGIHGVTMVWGLENLTGQHYEYLPGYMLIRKEEYFGVKWTLKL